MKQCDTCKAPLSDNYPFVDCQRCLFDLDEKAEGAEPDSTPDVGAWADGLEGVRGISRSRDFSQKYDRLERIGGGGQGDVWRTWDFELRREVAMKRLSLEALRSPSRVFRFLAEAQISSQLMHPGVLPIFDVGLDADGRPFYTTQVVDGKTFGDLWRETRTAGGAGGAINRALELLLRVCEVMAHAHMRGVIHRDLKPQNVLVGAFGDVRVIDWGSAHVLEERRESFESFVPFDQAPVQTDRGEIIKDHPASPEATANSGLPMTILFTPPELLRGELKLLGPRTDIYSMGVMLYELLAGRSPYSDKAGKLPSLPELRKLIVGGPPPPLRNIKRSVSRDLAAICEKAMAHSWAERYSSMEELADDIRAALEVRPVKARRPGPFLILQKWALRNISYVLLVGVGLVIVSLVLSFAHAFKAERDSARQIKAVREAEFAARSGRWNEALRSWEEARAKGYSDNIYLGLQEAEAWTVLSEPERAGALLNRLAKRSDLGGQRGVVLLRLGEHELFDRTAPAHGLQLVRNALASGLPRADQLFAEALLSESTPEALKLFHEALRFDPLHHGAHRHSLGLEFLLGRHQELSNHVAVFKILYPDDPSPRIITAAEMAMQGNLVGAQAELAGLRGQANSNVWAQMSVACRAYAEAANFYNVDALLRAPSPGKTSLGRLRTDPFAAGFLLVPGDSSGASNLPGSLRIPQLPCLQRGILEASDALRNLLTPFLGNPVVAMKQIESGWRRHPEALVPVLAGMVLENRLPPGGPKPLALLRMQSELYRRAADSPSMMPQVERLARYLAASTKFELAGRQQPDSMAARTNCLAYIQGAAQSAGTSLEEFHAYCGFALELGDSDLARELVCQWERRFPGDPLARRSRIRVELSARAFKPALEIIARVLAESPNDAWALEQRQIALSGVRNLLDSTDMPR